MQSACNGGIVLYGDEAAPALLRVGCARRTETESVGDRRCWPRLAIAGSHVRQAGMHPPELRGRAEGVK